MTAARKTYIDCDELAVRIAEACTLVRRPAGKTARQAMDELEAVQSESARGFYRAARAAANYIAECCNANYPGSVEVTTLSATDRGAIQ